MSFGMFPSRPSGFFKGFFPEPLSFFWGLLVVESLSVSEVSVLGSESSSEDEKVTLGLGFLLLGLRLRMDLCLDCPVFRYTWLEE
ncbi:hypothetical protein GDO81_028572 [Engystomops pustulosus]|uniref:Uncharacterized protein n=1 Tax=Engystomops pustulosus TaxID=76066 RepID=A0AAV6YFP2_ENGPU|nr:hypothetical protein GDO81_029849 [Engystomops pustulosus]KAG8535428.1 hypothetical protein GDO81_028572 [Engystomops pustulosus]